MELGFILFRGLIFYVWFSLSIKIFVSLQKDFESEEQVNGTWDLLKIIIKTLCKGAATVLLALFMVFGFLYSYGIDLEYKGVGLFLNDTVSIYSEVL